MMAYANNYVVSIIHNNRPIRETQHGLSGMRVVTLPFNSEYKIRVKNNTQLRALVDVTIDGASVFINRQQLILEPQQSVDLERFVDSLTNGRRFKFVSQEVAMKEGHFDPTTPDMGVVSVNFIPELKSLYSGATPQTILTSTSPFINTVGGVSNANMVADSLVSYSSIGVSGTMGPRGDRGITSDTISTNTVGGTVEGSNSNQSFRESTTNHLWNFPSQTKIDIKIKGPDSDTQMPETITRDGRVYKLQYTATSTDGTILFSYK